MRLKLRVHVVAFLLAVAACSATHAAQPGSGRLRGTVVDWQYALIPRTTIVFEKSPFKKTVEVNEEGEYDVELPAGTYLIKVASAPASSTAEKPM